MMTNSHRNSLSFFFFAGIVDVNTNCPTVDCGLIKDGDDGEGEDESEDEIDEVSSAMWSARAVVLVTGSLAFAVSMM